MLIITLPNGGITFIGDWKRRMKMFNFRVAFIGPISHLSHLELHFDDKTLTSNPRIQRNMITVTQSPTKHHGA